MASLFNNTDQQCDNNILKKILYLCLVWEFIKEMNGMEWNGMIIKGMEWNGIEWNGFSRERNGMECDLKILFGCYKINEWNGMESK